MWDFVVLSVPSAGTRNHVSARLLVKELITKISKLMHHLFLKMWTFFLFEFYGGFLSKYILSTRQKCLSWQTNILNPKQF